MPAHKIYRRIYIQGQHVEVVTFEEGLIVGHEITEDELQARQRGEQGDRRRTKRSTDRSRSHMTRVINANPDLVTFWTLTYAENKTDLLEANRDFKIFVQRCRRRWDGFKYVVGREFQDRGAVHYHLLTNIGWIDNNELERLWGQGFVKVRQVYNAGSLGIYFSKYIEKEWLNENGMAEFRIWSCSRNCERPRQVDDEEEISRIMAGLETDHCYYDREYKNERIGGVRFEKYLRRKGEAHG